MTTFSVLYSRGGEKMTEKIKISVPERIYEILRKDARDFRILKPSGEANLNAFINNLVMNYYENFARDDEALRESVKSSLAIIPEKYAKEAYPAVMKAISKKDGKSSMVNAFS